MYFSPDDYTFLNIQSKLNYGEERSDGGIPKFFIRWFPFLFRHDGMGWDPHLIQKERERQS